MDATPLLRVLCALWGSTNSSLTSIVWNAGVPTWGADQLSVGEAPNPAPPTKYPMPLSVIAVGAVTGGFTGPAWSASGVVTHCRSSAKSGPRVVPGNSTGRKAVARANPKVAQVPPKAAG